ncbi:MAG: NAD-dependent malic enzyme [Thermoguttaceae bacterium]
MIHQSPAFSFILRLSCPDQPGWLGRISSVIGEVDGLIGSVAVVGVHEDVITRDMVISATNEEHVKKIVERVQAIDGVSAISMTDRTFAMHRGGKIEVRSRIPVKDRDDLSMAYTPGVARVCRAIAEDPDAAFSLTIRRNTVAVVSDGTAVLGLGNIGPRAAMPVMEGKAILFKEFGGVNAFPICLEANGVDAIVATCTRLAPTFGGINLEDIASPNCFEIERQLTEQVDIPVFHDDQHGTAIVVLAALRNAFKVTGKEIANVRTVISGAGAAGVAIAKLLQSAGMRQIVLCDRRGAIHRERDQKTTAVKQWIAENTNPENVKGSLGDAVRGADVFIGVSGPNVLSVDDVRRMASKAIVFAMANPDPEIDPDLARPCAAVVATGRSDYPNQINNVLCFPGLFRGLLAVQSRRVTEPMKTAAAAAIANVISDDELKPDYIIPSVFDRRVGVAVAQAVARVAVETGVARHSPQEADVLWPS